MSTSKELFTQIREDELSLPKKIQITDEYFEIQSKFSLEINDRT